jgi:metallo-beta-lactamase family protein
VLKTDQDPFAFPGLKYIKTVEESKLLNFRNGPCVIISASGMAEAGRVKHHINNTVENSRNSILMTGYCEPNSLGAKLQSGRKEVNIFGVSREIHAEIGSIRSLSAHGDFEDLSQFISCQDMNKIKKLFLVHGEYNVQEDFKERLIHKGFKDVIIPEMHFELGLI